MHLQRRNTISMKTIKPVAWGLKGSHWLRISRLLLALTIVVWLAAAFAPFSITLNRLFCEIDDGHVRIAYLSGNPPDFKSSWGPSFESTIGSGVSGLWSKDIAFNRVYTATWVVNGITINSSRHDFMSPIWPFVFLWLSLSILFGYRRAKCRARVSKLERPCPVCEYELRGNISGNCPECGARIEPLVDPESLTTSRRR